MRRSDRWLALIRIGIGLWFLKAVKTKLSWFLLAGVLPLPTPSERWINFLPKRLAEFASQNPIGWYQDFLRDTAIPQAKLLASLTAFGEAGAGIGLTLGLLTSLSALVGLFIMLNYFLASSWIGFCQQGFHLLLMLCLLACLGGRAGRTWGVDGWLAKRYPRIFR